MLAQIARSTLIFPGRAGWCLRGRGRMNPSILKGFTRKAARVVKVWNLHIQRQEVKDVCRYSKL